MQSINIVNNDCVKLTMPLIPLDVRYFRLIFKEYTKCLSTYLLTYLLSYINDRLRVFYGSSYCFVLKFAYVNFQTKPASLC